MADELELQEQCYVLDKHLKALQESIVAVLATLPMSKDVADSIMDAIEAVTKAMAQNFLRIAVSRVREQNSDE